MSSNQRQNNTNEDGDDDRGQTTSSSSDDDVGPDDRGRRGTFDIAPLRAAFENMRLETRRRAIPGPSGDNPGFASRFPVRGLMAQPLQDTRPPVAEARGSRIPIRGIRGGRIAVHIPRPERVEVGAGDPGVYSPPPPQVIYYPAHPVIDDQEELAAGEGENQPQPPLVEDNMPADRDDEVGEPDN